MIPQKKRGIVKEESPSLSEIWEIPEDVPNVRHQSSSHPSGSLITYGSHSQLQNSMGLNAREDSESTRRQPTPSSLSQHASGSHGGAFIDGCDGMEINGGKFNQIYGHHTSVTINVHQPSEEEYKVLQQQPSGPPSRSSIPKIAEQTVSIPIKREPDNHYYSNVIPIAVYGQSSSSSHGYAPPNSNKIYEEHLQLKGRGFPLWIPEPNKRLPLPYRRKGVNIGDVGIITASGGFSFLFNICLPRGHPINPRVLPEGFAPISPAVEPEDICEFSEFKPGSHLASTSIEKIYNDTQSRGLSFETSAAEGAILTLPEGATALDLENVPRFRAYAAANIESWYRYANGPRGREAKNGEIRLVIGCDKATSWGMAAIANISQHKTHSLKYRPVDVIADNQTPSSTPPPIPLYKWEYSGLAEARVGPDLSEIAELKRNDDSDAAAEGKYWNQCLFLRTLNPTLSEEVFSAINQDLGLTLNLGSSQQFQNEGGLGQSSNDPSSLTGSQKNSSSRAPQADAKFGTQRGSKFFGRSDLSDLNTADMPIDDVDVKEYTVSRSISDIKADDVDDVDVKERVTMSRSKIAPKSHPADILNATILQMFPSSRVVITQDADWCSVIDESDNIMPSPAEIAERVLVIHDPFEEDGMIFLEPVQQKETSSKPKTGELGRMPLVSSSSSVESSPESQRSSAHHSTVGSFKAPALQLQNPRTQDVFQSIVKGRKSWKTLRGGEVVWPPELEAALLEGLENYQPDDSRETRLLGRFPMRNRFISDWIFEKTGKRRSAKQVGSRLQQLRDTFGGKRLLDLLSPNRRPPRTPSFAPEHQHKDGHMAFSPPLGHESAESESCSYFSASTPPTSTESHAALPNLLFHCVEPRVEETHATVVYIDLLPEESQDGPSPSLLASASQGAEERSWVKSGYKVARASQHPRRLCDIDPTITLLSKQAITAQSYFTVHTDDTLVFSEITALEPVDPSSAPTSDGSILYRTSVVPGYWDTIAQSSDASQYVIIQRVVQEPSSSSSSAIFSAMYKFNYVPSLQQQQQQSLDNVSSTSTNMVLTDQQQKMDFTLNTAPKPTLTTTHTRGPTGVARRQQLEIL